MSVNYIVQHREANNKLFDIKGFHSGHVSIYNALFLLWNQSGFQREFQIVRREVMTLSKVGSANTYTKVLSDLQKAGLITYKPSMNPLVPSVVSLYNFDKGGDKGINKGSGKGGDKGSDTGDDTYNTINIETIKLINKETIMGLVSVEENVPIFRKLQEDILNCLPIDESEVAEVVSYLNQKTGSSFKPETKETKRLIGARLKTHTLGDCKKVIETKVAQWQNDEKMKAYLTPTTLFAESNFEKYLNEVGKVNEIDENPYAGIYKTNEQLIREKRAEQIAKHGTFLNP
jgi:uncharacterized phage protein (TIGR02220 family)